MRDRIGNSFAEPVRRVPGIETTSLPSYASDSAAVSSRVTRCTILGSVAQGICKLARNLQAQRLLRETFLKERLPSRGLRDFLTLPVLWQAGLRITEDFEDGTACGGCERLKLRGLVLAGEDFPKAPVEMRLDLLGQVVEGLRINQMAARI